ncbi:MAG: MFS transporter [Myxococcales bacterium]|nr:MFS transporter [Myxococcales bacterium]
MSFGGRIRDANIVRIYATILALGISYGVVISLIAVFLDGRGFGKQAIGSLAAWFAGGIALAALPVGALVRKYSAKSVLVACLLGYACAVAAFPFVGGYAGIAAVRTLDGAFSAGVWVSSETILLTRAPSKDKAFVTSLYAISLALGYVIGPLLARAFVAVAPLPFAFVLSAAIALGAALFVLARLDGDTRASDPRDEQEHDTPRTTPATLVLWRIKTSCLATFSYGYFQASVVLFLPLFLIQERGIDKTQTILIPAFFAAGMLLFSNFAGRLGDRFGHLLVMRVLGSVGMLMVLGFALIETYPVMCAAVFVAGASLASISPLSLALQGVVSLPADVSRATAFYNAFYAAGMLLGPPVSSALFAQRGGASMLYHLTALWLAFVAFTLVFRRDDPARAALAVPSG